MAFDPPSHVVRFFARLMFDELLFILNLIINVFNDFDRMITTDETIAQRLERVLNLRIVTAGTELYDIMQDCLTIAKGGPSADGTVRARQRRRTDH